MREAKVYIGDAVYAEDLDDQLKLWKVRSWKAQRGFGTDWMVLGNAEIWTLLRWLRFRGWLPDEALEQLKAYTPSGPEERKDDDLGGLEHGE